MSRKENNKKKHPVLKAVGITAGCTAAAYGGYAYWLFRQAFDNENSRFVLPFDQNRTNDERNDEWWRNSDKSEEELTSFDGLSLHAYKLIGHPESHKWLIVQHGFHQCTRDMLNVLYEANERGFNLLAPDSRGCGASFGRYTGLGWPEHYDLISWIGRVIQLDKEAEIALYGVSCGAAAILNASGDYLPANVKCAVSDSAYSDLKEEIVYVADQYSDIPSRPFMPAVDLYLQAFVHYSMNEVSTLRQLTMSEIPSLFIHGEADRTVPARMVHELYGACAAEKEIWTVPGADHMQAQYQEGYYDRVFSFIEKHLAAAASPEAEGTEELVLTDNSDL
ncbi:MAG: alpha/beta hydrolase [Solobacterium sp.]|nr:alpha/beta hydrolase [Solobacterium sp.]